MKRLAFISRHAPTQEQTDLAATLGYEIIHVGDVDAFSGELHTSILTVSASADAIAGVHPNIVMMAAALNIPCWVFENASRPVEGGKPQFFCKGVMVWTPVELGDAVMMTWKHVEVDNPFGADTAEHATACRSV
jgi:hypothetical protein